MRNFKGWLKASALWKRLSMAIPSQAHFRDGFMGLPSGREQDVRGHD